MTTKMLDAGQKVKLVEDTRIDLPAENDEALSSYNLSHMILLAGTDVTVIRDSAPFSSHVEVEVIVGGVLKIVFTAHMDNLQQNYR